VYLDCRFAGLAGSNTHDVHEIGHHDLPITDLAGTGSLTCYSHDLLELSVSDKNLQANLGKERDRVLAPAIRLGFSFLPAEPFDLGHRHSLNARRRQRIPHVVQFVRPNDQIQLLHAASLYGTTSARARRSATCSDSVAPHKGKSRARPTRGGFLGRNVPETPRLGLIGRERARLAAHCLFRRHCRKRQFW
jgi:hypothetical protein